nr:hypothetical protein BDDEJBFL_00230 [Agrobacterium fabrum]
MASPIDCSRCEPLRDAAFELAGSSLYTVAVMSSSTNILLSTDRVQVDDTIHKYRRFECQTVDRLAPPGVFQD